MTKLILVNAQSSLLPPKQEDFIYSLRSNLMVLIWISAEEQPVIIADPVHQAWQANVIVSSEINKKISKRVLLTQKANKQTKNSE